MSRHYGTAVPEAEQIDYHEAEQTQRVERAFKQLDPGDVLAVIDSRIAGLASPQGHPLYQMVLFYLDRTTAVDGGAFYDRFRQLVLAAIDTCLDDALECLGEDEP
jgi:hypothetical protein